MPIPLRSDIDKKGAGYHEQGRRENVPMLTNNINQVFRGDVVHRILNNPEKRERLINDIIKYLEQYKLDGINIDFEELQEKKNEVLVSISERTI